MSSNTCDREGIPAEGAVGFCVCFAISFLSEEGLDAGDAEGADVDAGEATEGVDEGDRTGTAGVTEGVDDTEEAGCARGGSGTVDKSIRDAGVVAAFGVGAEETGDAF